MAKIPGADGGGGGLGQFIDREADTLLGRVDFIGLISAMGRSTVLAVFTGLTGIALAIEDALANGVGALTAAYRQVFTALASLPVDAQEAAASAASSELDAFGLFAAPVAVFVALLSMAAVLAVIVVFWGGDE